MAYYICPYCLPHHTLPVTMPHSVVYRTMPCPTTCVHTCPCLVAQCAVSNHMPMCLHSALPCPCPCAFVACTAHTTHAHTTTRESCAVCACVCTAIYLYRYAQKAHTAHAKRKTHTVHFIRQRSIGAFVNIAQYAQKYRYILYTFTCKKCLQYAFVCSTIQLQQSYNTTQYSARNTHSAVHSCKCCAVCTL